MGTLKRYTCRRGSHHSQTSNHLPPLTEAASALCVPDTRNCTSVIDLNKPHPVPGLPKERFSRGRIHLSCFKRDSSFDEKRVLVIFIISKVSFHSRIRFLQRQGSSERRRSCQSVMKNKSSTSAVALAKGAPRRASKLTLTIYKNHKKTSLSAGLENKKKVIIIVWVNKILLAV